MFRQMLRLMLGLRSMGGSRVGSYSSVEPIYLKVGLYRPQVELQIVLRTCRAICCWALMLSLCGGIGE